MSAGGKAGVIREYSLPLVAGVFAALAAANLVPDTYARLVGGAWPGGLSLLGHELTLQFLVNDLFMVLFFGIAAKEITDALLPGGALNPPSQAINPLLGTLGGVLGPVGVFLLLVELHYAGTPEFAAVANGWGVPTATDIALAWLAARIVFGARHPAVNFLLLLAVADDAIGLVIIAVFYPDPLHAVQPLQLLFTAAGMAAALGLRRAGVRTWLPYVLLGGGLAWFGLIQAHLHPALALVFIVPFLPADRRAAAGRPSLHASEPAAARASSAAMHASSAAVQASSAVVPARSPLEDFEHRLKAFVDYGLFAFAFCNAGIEFAHVGPLSWIILAALAVGKTVGIFGCSWLAARLGFPLPAGMDGRTLLTAGMVAGIGLTVALFVAGEAYPDAGLRGEAKMGALFSGGVFVLVLAVGRLLSIRRVVD